MVKKQEVRFQFGENWKNFSKIVDEDALHSAIQGLQRLLPEGFDPIGKTFLDIGSGSGLHSVAATRLGFASVTATDYDENSVEATKSNAERFLAPVNAFRDNILASDLNGRFDVVYSWGVLHHTGNMGKAVRAAADLVNPNGLLIIALYRKSPFCGVWRGIKRTYCIAPASIRKVAELAFFGVMSAAHWLSGKRQGDYSVRGMALYHDAIDWLGGYPYESISPDDIESLVGPDFFRIADFNTRPAPIMGALGTGCAEYVFRKGLLQLV